MSRTKRHKSQLEQNIEWGSRRIGNKGYRGMPCHAQKKFTARAERVKYRVELIKTLFIENDNTCSRSR